MTSYNIKTKDNLLLCVQKWKKPKKIKGTISLYRPSNQKLDFEMKISLSSPIMLIPNHKLVGGLWEISIHWKVDELAYLNKETVYF